MGTALRLLFKVLQYYHYSHFTIVVLVYAVHSIPTKIQKPADNSNLNSASWDSDDNDIGDGDDT